MKSWDSRPEEIANLLNPAFCGRVIYRCIQTHEAEGKTPMHYGLAFLVLPLVLYPETQATMMATTRHFQVWISSNQQIKLGLAARARTLVPYTREALVFLQRSKAVKMEPSNAALSVSAPLKRRRPGMIEQSPDTKNCLEKAAILGKWLAKLNSPRTAYASLGLMP